MKTQKDICYGECKEQSLDVYLPEKETYPVFVYFHGGGLTSGDKERHPVLYNYLVEHGIAVVSANYRMYPTARYPDFLHDAARAVAWVFKNIPNTEGIYIGGSSAGGYISQMLCFDPSYLAAHGIQTRDIAGYVHDAGQPTCHFNVLKERGIDSRRVIVDEAAPIYHIAAEQPYPPMLVIVSDNDMQNRIEQITLLVSTMKHFGYSDGVTLKLMHGKHCAYVNAVDESDRSIFGEMIRQFILKRRQAR